MMMKKGNWVEIVQEAGGVSSDPIAAVIVVGEMMSNGWAVI